MEQIEVQELTQKAYQEAFKRGFEMARALFRMNGRLDELEAVKKLPAGSLVKDARGRVLFRTCSNGWVTTSGTHFSTMYLGLPLEVLYHA